MFFINDQFPIKVITKSLYILYVQHQTLCTKLSELNLLKHDESATFSTDSSLNSSRVRKEMLSWFLSTELSNHVNTMIHLRDVKNGIVLYTF